MKKPVNISMIVGAGALSIKKLRKMPKKPEIMVTITAIINIFSNRLVSKNAIAPGAINRPIDRMMPTAERVATIVSDIIASKL